MRLSDDDLDITAQKINHIENDINHLKEQINLVMDNLSDQMASLKETQRYLIKLAQNQQELTKRISTWPYIVVNNKDEEV